MYFLLTQFLEDIKLERYHIKVLLSDLTDYTQRTSFCFISAHCTLRCCLNIRFLLESQSASWLEHTFSLKNCYEGVSRSCSLFIRSVKDSATDLVLFRPKLTQIQIGITRRVKWEPHSAFTSQRVAYLILRVKLRHYHTDAILLRDIALHSDAAENERWNVRATVNYAEWVCIKNWVGDTLPAICCPCPVYLRLPVHGHDMKWMAQSVC